MDPNSSNPGPATPRILTPAQWLAEKFSPLQTEYGVAAFERTDGNGRVFVKALNEDFLAATLGVVGCPTAPTVYVPAEGRFYRYSPDTGIFNLEDGDMLLAGLSNLLLDCARACPGCDTKSLEFGLRSASKLGGVLRKARGLLHVPHNYFSTELTEFIPCANGMLRLADKTLLPFSPQYRRRNRLAVKFEAGAGCPLFLDTLMRPALEPEDIDLLQRWCALPLIGENLAQRILILTGTAGGGKGTFVRVLAGIIGEANIASLRTHLLNERFEIGRFLGKTLLYGADVPENFLNQKGASVLKALTGYDQITLEFKNSNATPNILCKFPIIATCNSRLIVHLEDDAEAWQRRLAVVPYAKPKPSKVIAELDKHILAKEGSGVLNFMLAGLDMMRAEGWQLNLSGRQQRTVDDLLLESASHAVFGRECLMPDPQGKLTGADCYAAYAEYCHKRGWAPQPRNKFGPTIADLIAHQFGLAERNDIQDANLKCQCGWKGVRIRTALDSMA